MHFGETLGVQFQGIDSTLSWQVQDHSAGHNVPTAEHRRTVYLRRVEDDVELFQFVENHCCRLCGSSEKLENAPCSCRAVFKVIRSVFSSFVEVLNVGHHRSGAYLQAKKVGGVWIYYVRAQERVALLSLTITVVNQRNCCICLFNSFKGLTKRKSILFRVVGRFLMFGLSIRVSSLSKNLNITSRTSLGKDQERNHVVVPTFPQIQTTNKSNVMEARAHLKYWVGDRFIWNSHFRFFFGWQGSAHSGKCIFPDDPWRQHNKYADWVWTQPWGKQSQAMIDGYRFLEENRLTEHASVWYTGK